MDGYRNNIVTVKLTTPKRVQLPNGRVFMQNAKEQQKHHYQILLIFREDSNFRRDFWSGRRMRTVFTFIKISKNSSCKNKRKTSSKKHSQSI